MIPIGDDNSGRIRTPFINIAILVLNVLVFIFFQQMGTNLHAIAAYSVVPAEILSGKDLVVDGNLAASPNPVFLTILTSMFMHGGIGHIAGNMLYLWIFGDNLENVMGHFKYLVFYLLCGVLASLAHVFATKWLGHSEMIPSLGASGAISGVMGGYLLLFPRNEVRILFFRSVLIVPAFVTLGLWIVLQLIGGFSLMDSSGGGGVAYAAHLGGLAAGLLLVKFFADKNDIVKVR